VKAVSLRKVSKIMRRMGPYMLIELLLPGGTLLALLLWLSNGAGRGQLADVQEAAMQPITADCVVEARPQV
jgi:hypothetical protein